ncbi:MAG: HD domain-containing protein [Candidatus Scalindua sediminis]|nr:HD domain-containing protein [Candidatus Scalindua sediminis]
MMKSAISLLSKKFYDPLYDVITLKSKEENGFKKGRSFWENMSPRASTQETIINIIFDLLDTYEMNRLNFLRQSGLSFLFLPSATHTRFSHSLGTYYLGEQATARSWFKENGKLMSLRSMLIENGILDDFLVSLLLHDVGHFPFSHVLENNSCLYKMHIEEDNDPEVYFTHEDVACGLIDPSGDTEHHIFNSFRELLLSKAGGQGCLIDENKFLHKKLSNYAEKEFLDLKIIKYLITGRDIYFNGIEARKQKYVKMLKNLTSGLIDLDRMDHYRRDSLFMGVKLSNFSVLGLLDDVVLTMDGVMLREDGITHAISLLHGKESLVDGIFDDPINVAYEAMLNKAIEIYIDDKTSYKKDEVLGVLKSIIFLTDDELLNMLENDENNTIKRLVFDIKNRTPFKQLFRSPFECKNIKLETRKSVETLKLTINEKLDGKEKDNLVFRIPKTFVKDKKFDTWLDLDKMHDTSGNKVGLTTNLAEIDYFKGKSLKKPKQFYVFYAPELKQKNEELGNLIDDYVRNAKF